MTKQLLYPGRLSPLAIVVQAEVPENAAPEDHDNLHLDGLQEEADTIADLLHGAGYDVHVLSSGYYSELARLLSDADICERLVIFHYCGHANRKSVDMYLDNGDRLPVSAKGLAMQMATTSKALRLVYMNACLTEEQEEDFRAQLPQVNFIGTKLELEDWFAKKLALSIYGRLVGDEKVKGQTTIDAALTRAIGEDLGYSPIRMGAAMQITVDQGSGSIAELPDLNFKLAEGRGLITDYLIQHRETRSPSLIVAYCAVIIIVQGLFLLCSHLWSATSSPAFQAAFVYQPSCENLTDMIEGADAFYSGSAKASAKLAGHLGNLSLTCSADPEFALGDTANRFGFWIEWLRVGILCSLFVIIWTMIYNRLPRDYPNLELNELRSVRAEFAAWRKLEWNGVFTVLFVIGFVSVCAYHFWPAHRSLANLDLVTNPLGTMTWMQARWPFYINDDTIWADYHQSGLIGPAAQLTEGRRDLLKTLTVTDPLYFGLYVRPYLFYMGYSLVSYLLIAFPMLIIVVNSLRFTRRHMRIRLQGLSVGLRMTFDGYYHTADYIQRRLASIRNEMSRDFDRFVWLLGGLTLAFVFEAWIGRTTTALFAQIVMVLVFIFVVFGLATILNVWNGYREELARMRDMIEAIEGDEDAAKFAAFHDMISQSFVPIRKSAVIVFVLMLGLSIYFSILLNNSHWTPFTHALNIF